VILGYSRLYEPDRIERTLPDPTAARALLGRMRPDIPGRLAAIVERIGEHPLSGPSLDAALMGTARLGLRHGGFGEDPHDYHNEEHVLELAERRLGRVMDQMGMAALPAGHWLALLVFAACHDLRQREPRDVPGPVGGNEAASIAETFRILDTCGFRRAHDRAAYVALELMIAGSTFDPRPVPTTGAEPAMGAGGSLSRGLGLWLDSEKPDWRGDEQARLGERLARLSADLDTANVGEPFMFLADSALRLCRELQRRAGRPLDQASSGPGCLSFLGKGQLHYFFDLHRFNSREGEQVFGPGKADNAMRVRSVSAALEREFDGRPPDSGKAVMEAFERLCRTA
jgi:hypothetical protein